MDDNLCSTANSTTEAVGAACMLKKQWVNQSVPVMFDSLLLFPRWLPHMVLHMTCAGAYLPVEVTQVAGSSGANHGQQLMLQLPPGLARGSVQIEIARGSFISHAVVSTDLSIFCHDREIQHCIVPDLHLLVVLVAFSCNGYLAVLCSTAAFRHLS